MKRILPLGILAFGLTAMRLSALPIYDAFSDATAAGGTTYAVGSALIGQSLGSGVTWVSVSTGTNQPLIAAGNVAYPGMNVPLGNSVSVAPPAGLLTRVSLSATASPAFYYSFYLKVTDISAVSTSAANNYIAGFSDTTGSQTSGLSRCGSRLVSKASGGGYVLGVGKSSTTANYVYDTTVRQTNDVLFVIVSFETPSVGVTNALLWINPPSSSFGAATPPPANVTNLNTETGSSPLNANGPRAMVIACNNGMPSATLDELRVGNSWAVVTGGDPAITQLTANQTLPPGQNAFFNVTARGTDPISYQWIKDGATLSDGGNIVGSTTPSLTVQTISATDAGSYTVSISDSAGTVTSQPSTLTLSDPALVLQPQGTTNDFGQNVSLHVQAQGSGTLTYQWQKNGGNLSDGGNVIGAQTADLTLAQVSFFDVGSYSVIVQNTAGSTNSTPVIVFVRDPIVNSQPQNRTNVTGTQATFTASAIGSPPITYQWKHGSTILSNGGTISGSSSASLTISSVTPADAGSYTFTASGGQSGQTATSTAAILTVLDPVAITVPPSSRNVAVGNAFGLGVSVTGTAPISYQWFQNGNLVGTGSGYSVSSVQNSDAGTYFVTVSNVAGTATSTTATLTVTPSIIPLASSNLVVLRIGDGAQTIANTGNSIAFDQITRNAAYVNSISVPDSGPSALIQTGTSGTEGMLMNSMDKRLLTFCGFNTNHPYTSNVANSQSTNIQRAVATIDSSGAINFFTCGTNFNSEAIRSATTDGTNNFWVASSGTGTRYFGPGGATAQLQADILNTRVMQIFNGDLYFSTASGADFGIHKFSGLPTNTATRTLFLPTGTTNSFPYDFALSPSGTVAYVTDDGQKGGTLPNIPGIIKWTYDSGSALWISNYTLIANTGCRSIAVDFDANPPVVFVTTTESSNTRLLAIADTGANAAPTVLATAGANQWFKGVKFGPVSSTVVRPTISAALNGTTVTLSWTGSFVLQSASTVNGTYGDINGATSPYPYDTTSGPQQFFRLRQ